MTFSTICAIQGVYFAVTGVWPLLHMPSFVWVSGPKTDLWLVRTVAALALAMGLALLTASREPPHTSIAVLGVGSAIGFGSIDVFYVAKRRIAKIYLGDAAAEILFVAVWAVWFLSRQTG